MWSERMLLGEEPFVAVSIFVLLKLRSMPSGLPSSENRWKNSLLASQRLGPLDLVWQIRILVGRPDL